MFTGSTMGIGESFIISLMGLLTVFLTLIFLSLSVVIVSKLVGGASKSKGNTAKAAQPSTTKSVSTQSMAVKDEGEQEVYAAIIAAVSEEMRVSPDKFQIISIKEV